MLDILRNAMKERGIDWLIIMSKDPHLSEYTAKCDKYREAVSHFTGSAGTLVISEDGALLWTDMRYHLQAEKELEGSGITLMKYGMPSVPAWESWLFEHVWEGQCVGVDLMTMSFDRYKILAQRLPSSVQIADSHDLLMQCVDTGKRSFNEIINVPEEKSGMSTAAKIQKLRERISKRYVSDESYTYILSDLASVMWLLNIRGCDIEYVPVAYAYVLVSGYDITLFASRKNITDECRAALEEAGVKIKEYSTFYASLDDIATDVVLADPFFNNSRILSRFFDEGRFVECDDTYLIQKAYKNAAETCGMRSAHIKDAVVMIRFIRKIKEMAIKGELTDEYSIARMLDDMRLEAGCSSLSFETICAYGDNTAIVHYGVTKDAAKDVESKGFLLVDSGGQYKCEGTTDITRTISLGELSEEEKHVYTTVLKGNLRLMAMTFPEGFCGTMLDSVAESPLWDEGMYCGHGIGHGVGCYLSVHESEARISRSTSEREVAFRPGIIVSDEPGVYMAGKFGVRLENLLLTVRSDDHDGHRMCAFEPLTLVPFDKEAIDCSLLSYKEKKILSDYNALILEKLTPYLDKDDICWLKDNIDIM